MRPVRCPLFVVGLLALPVAASAVAPPFLQVGRSYSFSGEVSGGSGGATSKILEISGDWIRIEVRGEMLWVNTVAIPVVREISTEKAAKMEAREKPARAMADLRAIATASEAFAVDNDLYPDSPGGTLEPLVGLLSPTYIRTLPLKDPWDNPYLYYTDSTRQHYWVVSLGADGRRDGMLYDSSGRPKGDMKAETTKKPEDDLVFTDGSFVRHVAFED